MQLRPPMSGYGDKIRATMSGVFPDLLRAYQDATADRDLGNLPRHQPTTIMANTLRLLECFMLQVGPAHRTPVLTSLQDAKRSRWCLSGAATLGSAMPERLP